MKWYLSKIIFQIVCGSGEHVAQFDEQLILLSADNAEQAFIKAQQAGMSGESSFFNTKQKSVQWKFINVAELHPLKEINDGTELYSKIEEIAEADHYINNVHRRAKYIMQGHAELITEPL